VNDCNLIVTEVSLCLSYIDYVLITHL